MTREEVLKKDWQLLTAYAEMKTIAHLRAIMDNQAVIISELKKIPLETVVKRMTRFDRENYNEVVRQVQNNIPDYPDHPSPGHDYPKTTGER